MMRLAHDVEGTLPHPVTRRLERLQGALVNAHTTGAELLFEAKDFNGSVACIAHGSFFSNSRYLAGRTAGRGWHLYLRN